MKKLIVLLLSVLLIMQSIPVAYANESETMAVEYHFNENFETSPLGGDPVNGTCNSSGNKLYVAQSEVRAGCVLKYETTMASGFYYQHSVSPKGNKLIMDFDVMYDDVGFGNGTFRICFKDAANNEGLIANIDPNRNLVTPSGDVIAKLSAGKFYNICIVISTDTFRADFYVNQRKRASNVAFARSDFDSIKTLRYHLFLLKEAQYPNFYLDNVKAYEADEPIFKFEKRTGLVVDDDSNEISDKSVATSDDIEKYMKDTVALYVDQNKLAIDGEVQYLDPNDKNVKVFVENNRTYVPIRFVSEALECSVNWNEAERKAVISNEDTKVEITAESNDIIINGEKQKIDTAPLLKNDRLFIPVRAVCEAFGKKLTYDRCGLVVIADRENFFNFDTDLGIFRGLCGALVFDAPRGRDMVETLKQNFKGNAHPRLYVNSESLAKIREDIKTNPYMEKWASNVCGSANNLLKREVLKYELRDGSRLLAVSRDAKSFIETLSFAYLISGDKKYSDRAIAELMNVCSYPDWHPRHFLDAAEMMQAVAVGYDWLYDVLTAEQKAIIKDALIKFGLEEIMKDYTNDPSRERGNKWTTVSANNWNLVCSGSAIIAAMAIADEEPVLASAVIDAGMEDVKDAILMYAPDGAWFEGPGYWQYATSYYVNLMACLKSVYGTTFGYTDSPGVADTGYYINALSSKSGTFNFHDSTVSRENSPEQFFLADVSNDPALAQVRVNQMNDGKLNGTVRDLIYYNTDFVGASTNMVRDFYYRDTEVASMRNNWTENSSIFVGVHAGKVSVTHGHMDMGEFIIDGFGTRYAAPLGAESYNLGVGHWDLYRNRAEGHNTLVINPSDHGGQELSGKSVFETFESNDGCAMAITDITSGYSKSASRVKRGIKLTNNRSNIIIQDEITAIEPADVYWFMHTECDVQVAPDGKSAILKGDFKDLYVYLLEDAPGTFSVMDAQPFETSPVVTGQNKNLTYKKLTFHAENVTDMTLAIGMEFVFEGQDTNDVYRPEVTPLDDWKLDESKVESKPRLSSLKINGETVEGFDPETVNYSYRMKYEESAPVVTGEGDGKITVIMPDELPGYIFIKIASFEDSDVSETYVIKVNQEILSQAPPGLKTMSIASVVASSVPQPENNAENTLDNDLNTRWSAKGNANIVYDLGEIQKVSHLGIAVYQDRGDGRRQLFEILVSKDGENYTRVYGGESSGTTIEKEIFPITPSECRYIKIDCSGTNIGEWNSITEVAVYGPEK